MSNLFQHLRPPAVTFVLIAYALVLISCIATEPIDRIEYTTPKRSNSTLIVFLPGIFDSANEFERNGWVAAVRERGLPIDMISVEAHYGYYMAGTVIERLHADVITPAHRRGYRHIWLVGISLGGFGALLYSRAYPRDIEGAYLISPFIGYPGQGYGPAEWLENRNGQDGLWEWLAERSRQQDKGPSIFLAYGEDDEFADVNKQLASLLDRDHVVRRAGEHNWKTWKALWEEALERRPFGADQAGDELKAPG